MTGSDLGDFAAGEIVKIIVLVALIMLVPVAIGIGIGYKAGQRPPATQSDKDTEIYKQGYRDGILLVINYERETYEKKPYKTYEEMKEASKNDAQIPPWMNK